MSRINVIGLGMKSEILLLDLGKQTVIISLKVVGNEKEGRSGKWQMIDIGLGLW